jgi:hypothetical protein
MNTNNVTSTGSTALTDLIAKVMDKFDTDKDKKLSQAEFSQFLTGLLEGQVAAPAPAAATPAANTNPLPRAAESVHVGAFRSRLGGFDFRKMDDPTISGAMTSKYKAARIFQDYDPRPESLPAVIEKLRAQGVNATQIGIDKVDFGDGFGAIDVIQGAYPGGGVAWQWIPQGEIT